MATTAMDYEPTNGDRFEDDPPRYDRDQRSASPRRDDGHDGIRRRSASPSGNGERAPPGDSGAKGDDDESINRGSNLFVTGINPRLTEAEVTRLFEKYGEVETCQIMRDPHTKESRGFGFVKMVTSDQADAAKDGLQGEQIEGRTLSIDKARRDRPRTPTPGKYFGPPKREGGGDGRGGRFQRFDDRRRGGYGGGMGGGGYGRDDSYRYRGYDRGGGRDYDRGYDRGGRDYDRGYDRGGGRDYDRGYERRGDREEGYGGGRSGAYGGGRDDRERYPREGRRGGATGGGYDRGDREYRGSDRGGDAPRSRDAPPAGGYGDSTSRSEGRDAYDRGGMR